VPDDALEPHRGQVALVRPIDLDHAFVSLEGPLTYVIPRRDDCVFGGSNETSDNTAIDDDATQRILADCGRILGPGVTVELKEARVGLRPYRPIGVRVEAGMLADGRRVVHNYGHGGAGFSLSWGCAHNVVELVST
jgi:D-amino-acid oxidase